MSTANNLIFIGFMGCGKTLISKMIAKRIGFSCIDSDELITSSENRSITEIFSTDGESYFRKCEDKIFQSLMNVTNSCIAVGGGFPIYLNKPLHKLGDVIYLNKPLNSILQTLNPQDFDKRPLLSDTKQLKILYNQRLPIYEKTATITINADQSLMSIVDDIMYYLKC